MRFIFADLYPCSEVCLWKNLVTSHNFYMTRVNNKICWKESHNMIFLLFEERNKTKTERVLLQLLPHVTLINWTSWYNLNAEWASYNPYKNRRWNVLDAGSGIHWKGLKDLSVYLFNPTVLLMDTIIIKQCSTNLSFTCFLCLLSW